MLVSLVCGDGDVNCYFVYSSYTFLVNSTVVKYCACFIFSVIYILIQDCSYILLSGKKHFPTFMDLKDRINTTIFKNNAGKQ